MTKRPITEQHNDPSIRIPRQDKGHVLESHPSREIPVEPIPARAQARGSSRWLEMGLQASIALLVVSMLVQVPLVELTSGSTSMSIRSWDLAWALFTILALPWLWRRRARVDQLLSSRAPPLQLLVLFALLSIVSLSWGYLNFGSSELLEVRDQSVASGLRRLARDHADLAP